MRSATLPAAAMLLAATLAAAPTLAQTAAQNAATPPAAVQDVAGPPRDAGDAAAPAAEPADPTTSDMRCFVVAGALLGSDDEQLKSMGRASLFYYIGRLQGRGDTANMNARIVDEYAHMSEDDIRSQAKICSAQFTGATQSLQALSDALQQHFAPPAGAGAPK